MEDDDVVRRGASAAALDPLALLPPIATVLHSSEEPSTGLSDESSESTLTPFAPFGTTSTRRRVTDEESLAALLLRFESLHERVVVHARRGDASSSGAVAEVSATKALPSQRPSKRQRRALKRARDAATDGAGFEGRHARSYSTVAPP